MKPAERQGAQGKQTANQDCLVGFSRIRTPGTRDLAYIWSGKVLQLRGGGKTEQCHYFYFVNETSGWVSTAGKTKGKWKSGLLHRFNRCLLAFPEMMVMRANSS